VISRQTRRGAVAAASLALAIAFSPFAALAQTSVTDDGGRKVALPARIEHLLPAGPPASIDLLILAPDKLVGLTRALRPEQAAFFPGHAAALPGVGGLTGHGASLDAAGLAKLAPDLVIDIGDVNPGYVALADGVQRDSHIPYLLMEGKLADTPATFRKLGALIGAQQRADELARYAEETLALLKSRLASLPAEKRPSVYLARGESGLQTSPAGSLVAEAIDLAGARNVVPQGGRGRDVTIDQVLAWQPDYIIADDPKFYRSVWHDPDWQKLRAVGAKHVYLAPALPFGWVDEPPAANRLIGLRWLAHVLYPALFPEDLRAETQHFYALFFGQAPSDKQLDQLLAGTTPPG
jgi:iron complex transport system substrate-binding protein